MSPVTKNNDEHSDMIQALLDHPLEIEDFVPLSREELYDRNQESMDDRCVRVRAEPEERQLKQLSMMDELSSNPISEGLLKLTRDEPPDRNL